MNTGKLVFAQVMSHLPLTTFRRCVARYDGEHKVKHFSCLDQFLCMAFAQLTYRESLRDIEACLRSQSAKLYHMGFRSTVSRNTLANANAVRDWRIYADFAQSLIGIARPLYVDEPFGVDLSETVYALDATTIDLRLSVFPWALFRSTKAAIKLHTLLDLRGNIPSFIHISDGKLHVRHHLRSTGHADRLLFSATFSNDDQTYKDQRCRGQDVGLLDQPSRPAGAKHCRSLSLPLANRVVLQMDQAASAYQVLLRYFRERGQVSNLDRRLGLRSGRHSAKAAENYPIRPRPTWKCF